MINSIENIEISFLTPEDYKDLLEAMLKSYQSMPESYWREHQINALLKKFPEGQVVIKVNGAIAGCALSIVVDWSKFESQHTYEEITGNYSFDTHSYDGDTLYGIDVFIKPDYRGLRLGRRLYEYRKELCEKMNLKCIIFGGRIPNYHKHADKLSPKEYLDKVRNKEIHDPVLNFQMSNDFHPIKVLKSYFVEDTASKGYAVLLRWDNIYYEKPSQNARAQKKIVRLGIVQWQMRKYADFQDLIKQAEYFVDALSTYKSDFAVFPELFNAPLMASFDHLKEAEAIRSLAEFTPRILAEFTKMAISYNINIITGSMPELREGGLFNVGYLCRRDGTVDSYERIHVTSAEEKSWAMRGGSKLQTYDTDCGKIGVLVSFDVEFPELPRLLSDDGMKILFVPFLTDTQNGFSRVKSCSQARAIENECYVAIAGCVGNLPTIYNMDTQYAQSTVFTPCDFAFPNNGIKAEATTNTEMILITDVDLDLLVELHNYGSMRNLKSRRKDVFLLSRQE